MSDGFNFSEYGPNYYAAMSRRLAANVIKLEVYFGADRQTMMVRRNQDLVVRDIMEEVERMFNIPINEQVIFHKGNNLTAYMEKTLEQLGVENNHPIRINRDPELPNRSPRNRPPQHNQNMNGLPQSTYKSTYEPQMNNFQNYGQPQNYQMMNNQAPPVVQHNLDPKSYLKEINPTRVPDPTPYQVQVYNQQMMNPNNSNQKPRGPQDTLKLNISFGSEREYVLIHGDKPVKISDLKLALQRSFKIPPEQQCIVHKGYNIHDYLDEAPLTSFGLGNNSHVSVWPRAYNQNPDLRLPRAPDQLPTMLIADAYSNTPRINPGPGPNQRWPVNGGKIIKIEAAHGSDYHNIMLYETDKPLTVFDLQKELEKLSFVNVKDQRIFHRSHEVSKNPYMTLRDCEIENNSVVKLIGEPDSKVKYQNFFNTRPPGMESGSQGAIGGKLGDQAQQVPAPNQPMINTQYKMF